MMRFFEGYGDETSPARGERRGGGDAAGGKVSNVKQDNHCTLLYPNIDFHF